MKTRSLLAVLAAAPRRFRFDAAVRVLTKARRADNPAEAIRFRTPSGLIFPAADVLEVRGGNQPEVTVGLMGLTGPSGVLPRHYSETVTRTLRGRSTALHEFLDMLGHRFVGFFALAAAKYRPARAAEVAALRTPPRIDPVTSVLLSLTGYGTAGLAPRLLATTDPLLHYAGLFAMRPRSAHRLASLVSDWLGMRVEVVEFAGAWLQLPPDQLTRLGAHGRFNRLATDAAIGVRAWDPQARIVLRIGPLNRNGFQRLLPDRMALHRLVSLVRAYLGFELGFAINPILAAEDVPPLRLEPSADPPPRLGWNTWLPASGVRRTDAADAVFEAEVIEAQRITPASGAGQAMAGQAVAGPDLPGRRAA